MIWLLELTNYLDLVFAILISAMTFLLPIWILIRRRWRKPKEDGELIGTADDLARAEREIHRPLKELQAELLATHELALRLDTFSKNYDIHHAMDLVAYLNREGIPATHTFRETLPNGVASVINPHGEYEIYVPHGMTPRALELFEAWKNLKS